MTVLEVTALAVIVLGGEVAWFGAKTISGRWLVALSALALAGLLGFAVSQRIAVEVAARKALVDSGAPVTLREFCEVNPTEQICR